MPIDLHPIVPLLIGVLLALLPGVAWRRVVAFAAPVAALALLWCIQPVAGDLPAMPLDLPTASVLLSLAPQHITPIGWLFALAFALYATLVAIYSWNDTGTASRAATLGQAAGGIGVSLVTNYLALYFYWELLTVSSLVLIWLGGTKGSRGAGFRYLMFHLLGGLLLIGGFIVEVLQTGDMALRPLQPTTPQAWLILAGLVINAGLPPLHAWLPDAYPRATIYGTVVLAAFTTKSAVCVLARLFPGAEVLVWGGAIMAVFGVAMAMLENDIRRLLSYHIISQVGFMVCGVGMGTDMAINGASAHAVSHIFYKGLLMMSAGAVIYATGRGRLSDLGQLAGPLRLTLVFYMIGAFSISGVPLFNGFISKSMVVSAAAEAHRGAIELLLLAASVGTFLSVGLKLPWFAFGAIDHGARVHRPMPLSMTIAMTLSSAICIITGIFPGLLYQLLPFPVDYHPYSGYHIVQMLQLLLGTTIAFWVLRDRLAGKPCWTMDVDRLYRRPLFAMTDASGRALVDFSRAIDRWLIATIVGAWPRLQVWRNRTNVEAIGRQAAVVCLSLAAVAVAWLVLAR